jgi:hypothetical protein
MLYHVSNLQQVLHGVHPDQEMYRFLHIVHIRYIFVRLRLEVLRLKHLVNVLQYAIKAHRNLELITLGVNRTSATIMPQWYAPAFLNRGQDLAP